MMLMNTTTQYVSLACHDAMQIKTSIKNLKQRKEAARLNSRRQKQRNHHLDSYTVLIRGEPQNYKTVKAI